MELDQDEKLRLDCLKMANNPMKDLTEILETAQKMFDFVKGVKQEDASDAG